MTDRSVLCIEGEVIKEEPNEDHVEAVWLSHGVLEGSACGRAADVVHTLKVSIREAVATLDFAEVQQLVSIQSRTPIGV